MSNSPNTNSELIALAEKICPTKFSSSDNNSQQSSVVATRELLGRYFLPILQKIIAISPPSLWTCDSPHRAAFEALVRECVRHAWIHSNLVLDQIIVPLVQPKPLPEKGSQEEIHASYVSASPPPPPSSSYLSS
jgi:hypothetical protein